MDQRRRHRMGSDLFGIRSDIKRMAVDVTVAQLIAAGAVNTAFFQFPLSLAAGSRILAFKAKNKGSNITSSGGTISLLSMTLISAAHSTALLLANPSGFQTANQRGQSVLNGNALAEVDLPIESEWTPELRVLVAGTGVTMDTLLGGAEGLQAEIIYWEP